MERLLTGMVALLSLALPAGAQAVSPGDASGTPAAGTPAGGVAGESSAESPTEVPPAPRGRPAAAAPSPGYVGAGACIECHAEAFAAWRGSDHDLAMQAADEHSVLGDFDDARFERRGVTTRFFRRDGRYMVSTQGADGEMHEFEVDWVFGVRPLQQVLIGFPDGRYQALSVAWDSRPREAGGQRWFSLDPDEDVPPGDELHWTSPAYNWNFACAECHSTDLRKNYDAASDTYATTWAEVDVSCEACHGPGEGHVAAATAVREGRQAALPADKGLAVALGGAGTWRFAAGTVTALLEAPAPGAPEVELCGRCHARRSQLAEDTLPGPPLSDAHRVQLLTAGRYFPDGQILDEVYVYGSFRQSRMFSAGVTCSDCHQPHSLKLRADGNAACAGCHAPDAFDTPAHHHHEAGSPGARCVECHMPTRTYMGVDARRDHSLRIPRPDLAAQLGAPDACTQCHADKGEGWAQEAIEAWYGPSRKPGFQGYGPALSAARLGEAGAGAGLAALVLDTTAPTIARATALEELAAWLSPESLPAIEAGLGATDPLMRRAAVEAVQHVDLASRWQLVSPLLDDRVGGVRLAAAAALSDVRPADVDDAARRAALERGFAEYVASERFNADRAEHWVNLAGFHFDQGLVADAERDYAEARRRNPRFPPAWVNQADMYRALGREDDAEKLLREGIALLPRDGSLQHVLGLLLVRTGHRDEALQCLERAHRLAPQDARYGYVYGVALDSFGKPEQAIAAWEDTLAGHPNDRDVLDALVPALRAAGLAERALLHAEHRAALSPEDPAARQVVEALRVEAAAAARGEDPR